MDMLATRRRFLAGIGLLGGASLLAACGGAATTVVTTASAATAAATVAATSAAAAATTTTAAAVTKAAKATVASAATATVTAAQANGVTLQYLGQGSTDEMKIYQTFADNFHKQQPGITVQISFSPKGGAAGIFEQLQTQVAANAGPDVYWTHSYIGAALAKNGVAEVLNPFIDQDKTLKLTDYFTASYMDYTFNGNHTALPREIATDIMFYRPDLFDKAGVKYPDASWTWSDLQSTAKQLTTTAGGSTTFGYGGPVNSSFLYTSHALEDGSDIIDAQNYKSLFATDAVTQAIQYQADFIYKDHSAPTPAELKADNTIDFQHGRAAIAFSGYYLISTINGNTKNTWTYDVANMPVNTTGKRVSSSATSGHSAWSGTKHKQESWLWLKYLASEEASKIYGASGLVIPPLIALANSAEFTSSANPPHHRKVFIDDLAVAHPFPIVPNWLDVLTAINDMLAPVFAGTKTAKEAIDAGNAKLDTLLQQNAKS
jgi:multiple sugar transport system substrate-binding protein